MVAPVTGPYNKTITLKGPPTSLGYKPDWLQLSRTWYRQRKPYNLPLSYSMQQRRILSFSDTNTTQYVDVTQVWYAMPTDLTDNAFNQAYDRFVNGTASRPGIQQSADFATNIAEHRQASEMITKRLVQLGRAARAVRRFRFGEAAKIFGLSAARVRNFNLRKEAKAFGNNWLEFHFGWDPIVRDISSGIDILTSGLPPYKQQARAMLERRVLETVSNTASYKYYRFSKYEAGVSIQAFVSVENPNKWLANRLGLVNPAGLAWELIPFSFIVDWFGNLNDVLKSSSEFYGLTLLYPQHTRLNRVFHTEDQFWYPPPISNERTRKWSSEFVNVGRSTSIPGPTLRLRPVKALSWQRGLTACGLLLQSLKG